MKYLAVAFGTALWGAAVMWAVDPLHPDLAMMVPAFGGAFVAGLICAPLFLMPGWGWSALAGVLASGLGGALGGAGLALAGDAGAMSLLQAAMIGAAFVASMLLEVPLVLLIWLAGAVAMHFLARRLGRSRLSRLTP